MEKNSIKYYMEIDRYFYILKGYKELPNELS